jgi:hypothetical protein
MMVHVPAPPKAGDAYFIALRSYDVIMIVSQLASNHEFVVMVAKNEAMANAL